MREDRQRLDKWIWFARFARTRGAAQELIEAGRVRIDGRRVTTAAHPVRLGDVLTVAAPHETAVVRILGLGERRGDASSVAALYVRLADQ
jgi:ribosome-associated heat shock protein Hsp15